MMRPLTKVVVVLELGGEMVAAYRFVATNAESSKNVKYSIQLIIFSFYQKHQWFSGKIQRCHRWALGSIPGWCTYLFLVFLMLFFYLTSTRPMLLYLVRVVGGNKKVVSLRAGRISHDWIPRRWNADSSNLYVRRFINPIQNKL
jgi:hypothetical protein